MRAFVMADHDPNYAARKFEKRFAPVADSCDGIHAATLPVLAEHLREQIAAGDLTHRQAERLGGYLLTGGAGYPYRTKMRRRRELREHGLVLVDALNDPVDVDLGEALDAALAAWSDDA